jgi:hypothetical protein
MKETDPPLPAYLSAAEGLGHALSLVKAAISYEEHFPTPCRKSVLLAISVLFAVVAELDR